MFFNELDKHDFQQAITDSVGVQNYVELHEEIKQIASFLLKKLNKTHLQEERIALLFMPNRKYVAALCAVWLAGGVAVPLSHTHPTPEMAYIWEDAQCSFLLTETSLENKAKELQVFYALYESIENKNDRNIQFPKISDTQRALIIYTSGTTGKPKGVVSTHKNLKFQIETLVNSWQWNSKDKILHILPLHHIHGIVNALLCALYVGAEVHFLPKFEAEEVWKTWQVKGFTIFMAVPTIYNRLIATWEEATPATQMLMSESVRKMRLMISGSAALPVSTLEKWQKISGHFLLERYGMSEIGMAISNPLEGKRKEGYVGLPLPNIKVRLVDENGEEIIKNAEIGEIQVKGENVFLEYWNKKEATRDSFTEDIWFRTGDTAIRDEEGYFKILGRTSVDIIKTGGYKVSAIEVEEALRTHPLIKDCAVLGVANEEWGEQVTAFIMSKGIFSLEELRNWAKSRIAHYKIPTKIYFLDDFPRNALGKVQKNILKQKV
ncbi:MAG: acyl-CoA synthetase [Thermonemataceae bacterium]|nr:acyl-CoA synthetase [Thermonemataceae bacterium]